MARIVAGPPVWQILQQAPALIYIKPTWDAEWQYEPTLEMTRCVMSIGHHQLPTMSFERKYGNVKHPWQALSQIYGPGNIDQWWVMMALIDKQGVIPQWIGRVYQENRDMHGTQAFGIGQGVQKWIAYAPQYMLERAEFSTSIIGNSDPLAQLGFTLGFNLDKDGETIPNRSPAKQGKSYTFWFDDDAQMWTHFEIIEYLLERFLNKDDPDNPGEPDPTTPQWFIDGEGIEALENTTAPLAIDSVTNVGDTIRQMVNPSKGIDWMVLANDTDPAAGLSLFIFALQIEPVNLVGETLPGNPRFTDLSVNDNLEQQTVQISGTSEQRYGAVRVVGERMVACFTMYGVETAGAGVSIDPAIPAVNGFGGGGPWEPGYDHDWPLALRTQYLAGFPGYDVKLQDKLRKQSRYRPLWQHFKINTFIPWLWNDFTAIPWLNGTLTPDFQDPDTPQRYAKLEALNWVPLRDQTDYASPTINIDGPIYSGSGVASDADLLKPTFYFRQVNEDIENDPGIFVPSEQLGVALSMAKKGLGFELRGPIPHYIAKETVTEDEIIFGTEIPPTYDFENGFITLAIETDQRIFLQQDIPGALPSDGIKIIEVPEAESWYVAPGTMVPGNENVTQNAIDPQAVAYTKQGFWTRDDSPALANALVGAIARYLANRGRARVRLIGLWAFGNLTGAMLRNVVQGDDTIAINGPITAVEWVIQGTEDGNSIVVTNVFSGYGGG